MCPQLETELLPMIPFSLISHRGDSAQTITQPGHTSMPPDAMQCPYMPAARLRNRALNSHDQNNSHTPKAQSSKLYLLPSTEEAEKGTLETGADSAARSF